MIIESLQPLAERICRAHQEAQMEHGHNAEHALRVGAMAYVIVQHEWPGEEFSDLPSLAMASGYCHNADRILAKQSGVWRKEIPESEVAAMVSVWLETMAFPSASKDRVIAAVLKHEEPNRVHDEPILIALKDADRVVNASLDVVIRAGQLQPNLPVIDPRLLVWDDERGKFNRRWTVVADLADCIREWAPR